MKLQGILGKGTGKLGNAVFAVSGGEQIMREYNPHVSNPNTEAQVAQRAKLKLMSQIAAALAPAIAFKKEGLVSARNKFVQANISKCVYEDRSASIPLSSIDLTGGVASFPALTIVHDGENPISVAASAAVADNVKVVVYVLCKQTAVNTLEVLEVKMVNTPGEGRTFATTFPNVVGELAVYAYGVYITRSTSNVRFDNYFVEVSEDEASLGIINSLIASGGAATKTVCELD